MSCSRMQVKIRSQSIKRSHLQLSLFVLYFPVEFEWKMSYLRTIKKHHFENLFHFHQYRPPSCLPLNADHLEEIKHKRRNV
jgi:hypothetical protein